MVLAYQCPEHGLHDECDVNEGGQRICPTDETDIAVTGIVGSPRKPDSNGMINGDTEWIIGIGYGTESILVSAFDYKGAFEEALEQLGPEAHITEIKPRKRSERY